MNRYFIYFSRLPYTTDEALTDARDSVTYHAIAKMFGLSFEFQTFADALGLPDGHIDAQVEVFDKPGIDVSKLFEKEVRIKFPEAVLLEVREFEPDYQFTKEGSAFTGWNLIRYLPVYPDKKGIV